jgi:hypothetical protein
METLKSDFPDALEASMQNQATSTAIALFVRLPPAHRCAVILKTVLGHSLDDIAQLQGITINAVKGNLARGRLQLKEINNCPAKRPVSRAPSEAVARYVNLFNKGDWESLRALLAEDVRLAQSHHAPRAGAADVGTFFTIYAHVPMVRLVPAWLGDREVIAVFEGDQVGRPNHLMWLEWRDGLITFIRDYRYVGYVIDDADLLFAD